MSFFTITFVGKREDGWLATGGRGFFIIPLLGKSEDGWLATGSSMRRKKEKGGEEGGDGLAYLKSKDPKPDVWGKRL